MRFTLHLCIAFNLPLKYSSCLPLSRQLGLPSHTNWFGKDPFFILKQFFASTVHVIAICRVIPSSPFIFFKSSFIIPTIRSQIHYPMGCLRLFSAFLSQISLSASLHHHFGTLSHCHLRSFLAPQIPLFNFLKKALRFPWVFC